MCAPTQARTPGPAVSSTAPRGCPGIPHIAGPPVQGVLTPSAQQFPPIPGVIPESLSGGSEPLSPFATAPGTLCLLQSYWPFQGTQARGKTGHPGTPTSNLTLRKNLSSILEPCVAWTSPPPSLTFSLPLLCTLPWPHPPSQGPQTPSPHPHTHSTQGCAHFSMVVPRIPSSSALQDAVLHPVPIQCQCHHLKEAHPACPGTSLTVTFHFLVLFSSWHLAVTAVHSQCSR